MRVITYGTFDLLHEGHINLLRRAKALGDYLIVGVTSTAYDESRGKLNVRQSVLERANAVQALDIADEIIIEEYEGQKVNDVQRYNVDIFAIGSDWVGKFDYLNEYCKVVYLERTRGISSTQLRNASGQLLQLGIVGSGRIASRFIAEARFVSGVEVIGAYSTTPANTERFVNQHELGIAATSLEQLLPDCSAVYVASPHTTHYDYAKRALEAGKHVLCEKPMALVADQVRDLQAIAQENELVLLEALKTAFLPGFERLVGYAKSGSIGDIRAVDATFTKLVPPGTREYDPELGGGSLSELASYPLLPVLKLLGTNYDSMETTVLPASTGVDEFARINLRYPNAIASVTTGIGVKSEGELVISGSKGYIYVPAPWWLTKGFEGRFEKVSENQQFHARFDGDGLRYEIAEFQRLIAGDGESHRLRPADSLWFAEVLEAARARNAQIR